MRILLMYRLMNGLEPVLQSKTWSPSGIPTAARLIEALDNSDHDVDLVLYPSELGSMPKRVGNKTHQYNVEGLNTTITIVDYGMLNHLPRRLAQNLTSFYLAWWSLKYARLRKPDIYYTDRGNVIAASLITRMTNIRTVLRVFGVPSALWQVLNNNYHPLLIAMRWAFRARFDAVIGTRDGSNIKAFLDRALSDEVPRHIRINGHIPVPKLSQSGQTEEPSSQIVKIVYLGRLDQGKGVKTVIEAVLDLSRTLRKKCSLTIIGSGPMEAQLHKYVEEEKGTNQVTFLGRIENKKVPAELVHHDIYISLNESGQISNANIEAASSGLAMIFADTVSGDDVDACEVFDDKTVIRIGRKNLKSTLNNVLAELINNPEKIERLKKASLAAAARLPQWDERILWEIDLLEQMSFDKQE